MLRVGDKIKNLRQGGTNGGKYGTIIDIDFGKAYVMYDDGSEGSSDEPDRYYQFVSRSEVSRCEGGSCAINNEVTGINKIMLNVKEFVKNSLLSADEKALREVGFKDSCGDFTQTAKDFAIISLCEDKEAKMIEVAKAIQTEAKKK
jgi:hypothetical protein